MQAADWYKLGNKFFRNRDIYEEMLWREDDGSMLNLEKYVIAAGQFGGPIAMVRDHRKLVSIASSDAKTRMKIYSGSGSLISKFDWDHHGLIKMGWSDAEYLVCVLHNGSIYIYDVTGRQIDHFTMGMECENELIGDAVILANGLVVRTVENLNIWVVDDFDNPEPIKYADPELSRPPVCMAVIPPDPTQRRPLQVLLATQEGSVVNVTRMEHMDQNIDKGPFTHISVSPAGDRLALFNENGDIWVVGSDFTNSLLTCTTGRKQPPESLQWVGKDAVMLQCGNKKKKIWTLLMVGKCANYHSFNYKTPPFLVREIDGLRIITAQKHELLQVVPQCTENIFAIGSTKEASLLFDATEEFYENDAKADEDRRSIEDMDLAVTECLEAARQEFDMDVQKKLLKAAAYGKVFIAADFDADMFVDTCKAIRVLNSLAQPDVGIRLTWAQYERLTPPILVNRLITRKHYNLAVKICEYLRMAPDKVLEKWACSKIQDCNRRVPDEELKKEIVNKLAPYKGLSYARIARTAFQTRTALAIELVNCEPKAQEQVRSLIEFDQHEVALKKAIKSNDTDLVYITLLKLMNKYSEKPEQMFDIIIQHPLAKDLFVKYCKTERSELLGRFYAHQQDIEGVTYSSIRQAYLSIDPMKKMHEFKYARDFYAKDKSFIWQSKMMEEKMRLIQFASQVPVELDYKSPEDRIPPTELTCSELMARLVKNKQPKLAKKLIKDLNISERRRWYITVGVLAENHEWARLELFVSQKKPPATYMSVVEACLEQNEAREARKYVLKLSDAAEKCHLLTSLQYWEDAIKVAVQAKEFDWLHTINAKCNDSRIKEDIKLILQEVK